MRVWIDLTNSPYVLVMRPVIEEAIPPARLEPYGAGPAKLGRYAGLKEEYHLADFEPGDAVLAELGIDPARPLAVVRTPPAVSLYHRFAAQSLIAHADLVISAGGTMNREAAALGTPVWTTFEGRLGAVDERLIADGRLKRLMRGADVVLERRADPALPRCVATPRTSPTCS